MVSTEESEPVGKSNNKWENNNSGIEDGESEALVLAIFIGPGNREEGNGAIANSAGNGGASILDPEWTVAWVLDVLSGPHLNAPLAIVACPVPVT
jgi:hypothetical protein